MNRQSGILWAVGLGIVGSLGCDKAGPTEPARDLADMSIAEVAPSPADLSGTWSGTITFHAFESDTEVLPCDGTASIRVILRQDGGSLSGQFETACAGELTIRGLVDGIGISGVLNGSSGHSYGLIEGTAFSGSIREPSRTILGPGGAPLLRGRSARAYPNPARTPQNEPAWPPPETSRSQRLEAHLSEVLIIAQEGRVAWLT